jgi:hypothetical protein
MARPSKRTEEIRHTLRVDKAMDMNMKILYSIDKKVMGRISFNDWLLLVMNKYIDSRDNDITIVRNAMNTMNKENSKGVKKLLFHSNL